MVSRSVAAPVPVHRVLRRPIRVAYVIQNLNYGGMERVLHSLARYLPQRGFDVHVVVLEYFGHFAEGLDDSVTLHQVAPLSRLSVIHPRELAVVLRAISPDVVHSHGGIWFQAIRAARQAGARVTVHTEHGRPNPVPLVERLIDNWASRSTDVILAVSESLAAVLRHQVVHDASRVRVITNGVDAGRARPSADCLAMRRELGVPEGSLVVGSIGRLEPVKNFQLALRAFARLGPRTGAGPAPILVLVGDGSERGGLEALASVLGIAPRVMFLGWRADAERIYGTFDLFTLTSRSEGTSISLLEAMSMGLCPIVTDVGGNRAVLGPDLESLLVPGDDEVALAAAWQRWLADPDARAEMGTRARTRVRSVFSLESMVEQHIVLYQELVGASTTPAATTLHAPLQGDA